MFTTGPRPNKMQLFRFQEVALLPQHQLQVAIGVFWILFACSPLSTAFGQQPQTAQGPSPEAQALLRQADSLLLHDKPVSALTRYRGVMNHTFDLCQLAKAHRGIATIYLSTGHTEEAQWELEQAEQGLIGCNSSDRLELVQALAERWMSLHEDERAMELVDRELERQPQSAPLLTLQVRIAFARGEFRAAESAVDRLLHHIAQDGVTPAVQVELRKIKVLSQLFETKRLEDSDLASLHQSLLTLPEIEAQAVRSAIHDAIEAQGLHEQAWVWANEMLAKAPEKDDEAKADAYMRMARSAFAAGREIEAVFAHEQAIRFAGVAGNQMLLAQALRGHAQFERARGNPEGALASLWQLDTLQSGMLLARPAGLAAAKSLMPQPTEDPDPFDAAVASIQSAQPLPHRAGMWPWWVALLLLVALGLGLHNQRMKRALRSERSRVVRLRSLASLQGWQELTDLPQGAEHAREDLQEIREVLRELDAELMLPIRWEVAEDAHVTLTTEVRRTLRQLLQRFRELDATNQPIDIRVEQEDREWRFSLASEHTEASKALKGIFTGQESQRIPVWRDVIQQLQAITARVIVERLSSHRERLTVTLPLKR
jgi:tetratricopeptide (TPR) repeat protein